VPSAVERGCAKVVGGGRGGQSGEGRMQRVVLRGEEGGFGVTQRRGDGKLLPGNGRRKVNVRQRERKKRQRGREQLEVHLAVPSGDLL